MENIWILLLAVGIFLLTNLLCYTLMKDYVKEAFGAKWLKPWGNKLYFWQSSIFLSTMSTVLIICVLKWTDVLGI